MGFSLRSIVKALSGCFKGDNRSARSIERPQEEEVLEPPRMAIPCRAVDYEGPGYQAWSYPIFQHPPRAAVNARQPIAQRAHHTCKPKKRRLSSSCYSDVDPSSFGADSLPRFRGNHDQFAREWTGMTTNPYITYEDQAREDLEFYAQFAKGPYGTRSGRVG